MSVKRVVVIDGNLLIHKSRHVFRNLNVVTESGMIKTGVAYVFIRGIMRMNKIYHPCEMCVVFDNSMNITSPIKGRVISYREEILSSYKADRSHNDDMIEGVRLLFRFLKALPITIAYPSARYEADDVVSHVVLKAFSDYIFNGSKGKYETIIVSEDKDFYQLIFEYNGFCVKMHKAKDKIWDVRMFRKKFGFSSDRFVSYLSLLGDKGDNIPGVHGYGKIKASQMVRNFSPQDIPDKLKEDQVATFLTNVILITLVSDKEVVSNIHKSSLNKLKFNFLAKKYKMISFLRKEEQELLENIKGLSF